MWRITLYRLWGSRRAVYNNIYQHTVTLFKEEGYQVDVWYSMLVMVNVGVPRFTSKHNVCMTFKPLLPRGPKNHGIPWHLTQRDENTILGSDMSFWDKSSYFDAQWSLLRNNIWVLRPTPFISWALLFSCNGCLSSIVIQLYDLLPPLCTFG